MDKECKGSCDVFDKLCRQEIEQEIEDLKIQKEYLQSQLCMDALRDLQLAQTAEILANQRAPVSRNWINAVLNVLIAVGVIFFLWIGCFIMTVNR